MSSTLHPQPSDASALGSDALRTLVADTVADALADFTAGFSTQVAALVGEQAASTSKPERRDPLLNVDEVAEYLAVSRRTVETLIAEGALVPLRIRGTRRFTYEAVDAYLRSLGGKRGRA